MSEGKIKKLTDKGFGFIEQLNGSEDLFFHSSSVTNAEYESLREGQRVNYDVGKGPRGPRAEKVQLVED